MKADYLSTKLALAFAVIAGLAIGNLYWAQPLLANIATSFGLPISDGGILVTATQVGYALGIFFLVPLGDIASRRKLLLTVMSLTILTLVLCLLSPYFWFLSLALVLMGICTVAGQIILPLTGDLAAPSQQGKLIGIVVSGITIGILLARFISGIVVELAGWRSIYLLAVVLNLAALGLAWQCVPRGIPIKNHMSYMRLLLSVFTTAKCFPSMWTIFVIQGMVFGIIFNSFWTAMTFLLTETFAFNTLQIGVFSLSGLTGALAGVYLGGLHDKGRGGFYKGLFVIGTLVSMVASVYFYTSLIALLLIAAFFALMMQGVSVISQAQLFQLSDTERSRLNTAFVVSNFIFGACGSLLATYLWKAGGWPLVAIGATAASLLALLVWLWEEYR
ncbi:MAG: MFS transporter [Veillonellaceae bacterium]|nr:MFS transporter [Veillonellaceae bacterium]